MTFTILLVLAVLALPVLAKVLRGRSAPLTAPFRARAYAIDGDTLAFGDRRVRLHGIDAPERGQAEGPAATAMLVRLIGGQPVTVTPVETDRYGRIVARVTNAEDCDLSAAMVMTGHALAATRSTTAYTRLEREARRARRGLWARPEGIPNPAAWRALQARRA